LGKNFIVTLLAVVLTLGGMAWLSDAGRQTKAAAGTNDAAQSYSAQQDNARVGYASTASDTGTQAAQDSTQAGSSDSNTPSYNEGYKAGYRDGQRDCAQSHTASATSGYTARRVSYSRGVAGATYYRETRHHNHHLRNMILTIAAPAALGAGIGAIAGGGRGA